MYDPPFAKFEATDQIGKIELLRSRPNDVPLAWARPFRAADPIDRSPYLVFNLCLTTVAAADLTVAAATLDKWL